MVSEQQYVPHLIALAFLIPLAVAWLMLGPAFGYPAAVIAAVLLAGALFGITCTLWMFRVLKPLLKRAVRQNLADRGLLALIVDTQSTDLSRSHHYMLRTGALDAGTVGGDICYRLRALIANYTQLCLLFREWPVPRRLFQALRAGTIASYPLFASIALAPIMGFFGPNNYVLQDTVYDVYYTLVITICVPLLTILVWLRLLYQSILKRSVAEVVWEILGEDMEEQLGETQRVGLRGNAGEAL